MAILSTVSVCKYSVRFWNVSASRGRSRHRRIMMFDLNGNADFIDIKIKIRSYFLGAGRRLVRNIFAKIRTFIMFGFCRHR